MTELDVSVFELDRGRAALEKWAVLNHLTVQVFDVDGRPVAGPVNRTMLFELFSRGSAPRMFVRCSRIPARRSSSKRSTGSP